MKVEGYGLAYFKKYRGLLKHKEAVQYRLEALQEMEPRITYSYGSAGGCTNTEDIVIARLDREAELLKAMKRIDTELAYYQQALNQLTDKQRATIEGQVKRSPSQADNKRLFIEYRRARTG